jgi:hypothetical protein
MRQDRPMSEDADDEMTEAHEEAWCQERREQIADYLARQGLSHGAISEWPAWYLAPYLSVWAIESLKAPGKVGWWAMCGELPSDYCAFSEDCDEPRWAVRQIAGNWREALASTAKGAETIGDTGLPIELADILQARADLLLEWVDDDDVWDYGDEPT